MESIQMKSLNILMLFMILCLSGVTTAAEMSSDVPLELEKPPYTTPWQRYNRWKQIDWKEYSNLRYDVPSPISTPKKFETPITGDPKKGKQLVETRKRGGGCLACHILPDAALPGNVGPSLSLIGLWGRSDAHLFNYIYDARQFYPNTVMPPWGAHQLFSTAEIKDIVAYLKTLTQISHYNKFKSPIDNPAIRPIHVDTRDNLDAFENPSIFSVELGEELFAQSCQTCHKKTTDFIAWASTMPKFETRLNKVIGIEEFITRHALATTGDKYLLQTEQNLALAIYLRYIANGQEIAIDTRDAQTQAAIKRGEALANRKIGQLNFACMDCHAISVNKWIRGQYLIEPIGMYDHFPTYRTSRGEIWDIRKRFQWCGVAIRANELPPDAPEYGDLEIYLADINKGRLLNVPGLGH